jgi:DNA-binding response OmpR family regulator
VLLIEDNADTRELLADFLEEQGFRVYAASDGLRGVELALARRPRALVVDIGLPGLDGYEVAREVRKAVGKDSYLIALSGYGLPDDRRRALEAGFDVHLTKPVAVDSLVERLNGLSPGRTP